MLTPPQRKALTFLRYRQDKPANGRDWATSAEIGYAMGGTKTGKAQGAGRLGGTMAWRLVKRGLVMDVSNLYHDGFSAYRITDAGREALDEQ